MITPGFKTALLLTLGIVFATSIAHHAFKKNTVSVVPPHVAEAFQTWAATHKKTYSSPKEAAYRLSVFHKHYVEVEEHKKDKTLTYTLGLNHFCDLTIEEIRIKHMGLNFKGETTEVEMKHLEGTPSNDQDWVAAGAVTAVKNQGNCGSCWAFSSTGALEGLDFIANKLAQVNSYSEQQLCDCSWAQGNQGCNGGLMQQAFTYVTKNGVATEASYPYVAHDQVCKSKSGSFHIKSYKNVPHRSSSALSHACDTQPISISIHADTITKYTGGVYNNPACGSQLDHGVLLTGYDSSVWHVKNSWGTSWGEQGYIRFSRTAVPDKLGGICGILLDASYPTE